jgi:hypothetical protein
MAKGAGDVYKATEHAANMVRVAGYEAIHGPLQAVDAILGAPQRFVSGMANAGGHEALDLQHPQHAAAELQQWVAHGLDVATHPFNERMQATNIQQTLESLGMQRQLDKFNKYVEGSAQPEWLKHFETPAARFGAVLASQLITDPTGVIAPLRLASQAARTANAAGEASKAVKAVLGTDGAFRPVQKMAQTYGQTGLGKVMRNVFARRPELDEHLDPMAKEARLSIEAKTEEGYLHPLIRKDEALVKSAKEANAAPKPVTAPQPAAPATKPNIVRPSGVQPKQAAPSADPPINRFARDVLDAYNKVKEPSAAAGTGKKFIGQVYDEYKKSGGGATLPEFKHYLLEATQKGLIRTSRADLVDAFDAGDVAKSETGTYGNDVLHFVSGPGAKAHTLTQTVAQSRPPFQPPPPPQPRLAPPPLAPPKNVVQVITPEIRKRIEDEAKIRPGVNVEDDLLAIQDGHVDLAKRLEEGRWKTTRHIIDTKFEQYLNKFGGAKDSLKKPADQNVSLFTNKPPAEEYDLSKLSYGPPKNKQTILTKAGKLGTASVEGNPLPHGLKNLGDLTYLAGGPRAYGAGLAYTSKGLDARQIQRMLNMGLSTPDYLHDIAGPLSAVLKPGQQLLNRLELGYRQGLLDHYDAAMGPSRTIQDEYAKAGLIRRDLGDYRNVSAFIRFLQAMGGPFVAFRIGTIPSAVGRALLSNPQRLENLVRPDVDVNTDPNLMGKSPSEAVTGGPGDDFAKVIFDTPDYLSSPSTLGPLGQLYSQFKETQQGYGERLSEAASQLADQYVPGAAAARTGAEFYAATGLPGSTQARGLADAAYGSTPGVSALQEALYSIYGGYYKKRPSGRNRSQAIKHIENPR